MMVQSLDLRSLDIRGITKLLQTGSIKVVDLVEAYLTQIEKFNPILRAVLCTAPRDSLLQMAKDRDRELQEGVKRGPLHGIPILLKDNIDTDMSLGMPTTAGSLALLDARTHRSATLVDSLLDAGAIIIGKANMSELMNCKGRGMISGWSAVGGQCVSAYVAGGIRPGDKHAGHSSPGGSSTGSAVGVSAGFAPVSIGAETSGSLVEPAIRAALYTLKPTIQLIPQQGLVPVSHTFDSAGPMAKTVYDIAVLLDAMVTSKPQDSYTKYLCSNWTNLRIGTLDPRKWRKDTDACDPDLRADAQMHAETNKAYRSISGQCARFVSHIDLNNPNMNLDGRDSFGVINNADYKVDLTAYLTGLEYSQVRSIQDLVDYNEKHADSELPSHHPRQDVLKLVSTYPVAVNDETYNACLAHLRRVSRDDAIDLALKKHEIDVIIGPGDSELAGLAAAAGYPIATMPLSYLDLNGRPFGVVALASAGQEGKLLEVMSAWEATFSNAWKPPNEYGLDSQQCCRAKDVTPR